MASFILAILAGILARGWQALVLCKLWQWYIVPGFNMVPLTEIQAFGMILVFATLQGEPWMWEDHEPSVRGQVVMGFLYPLVVLCMGWLLLNFV